MSKLACVKLEKIFDINMYLFIEKAQRGGISYVAKRYAKDMQQIREKLWP